MYLCVCSIDFVTFYEFIYYTPTHREGAILQSPCPSVRPFFRPSVCPSVRYSVRPLVRPFVRLSIRSHFRNRYLSFYWKKWLHIYFLFTVRLTNERVGVFLAWRSVQHLVAFSTVWYFLVFILLNLHIIVQSWTDMIHQSSLPEHYLVLVGRCVTWSLVCRIFLLLVHLSLFQ